MKVITIGPLGAGDATSCNIDACKNTAIRSLRFEGSAFTTSIRLCLAHLRELRDVVLDRVG